jgi:hypothetical protein
LRWYVREGKGIFVGVSGDREERFSQRSLRSQRGTLREMIVRLIGDPELALEFG